MFGQPDENALGASDVAEPIHVFVLNHLVDELRAVSAEPGERNVEVVHSGPMFLVLGVGTEIAALLALLAFFRRRGWF